MKNSEHFFLDATLVDQIRVHAFRAILINGHSLVAHCGGRNGAENKELRKGDVVRLDMSPYDMSRGRIVFPQPRVSP